MKRILLAPNASQVGETRVPGPVGKDEGTNIVPYLLGEGLGKGAQRGTCSYRVAGDPAPPQAPLRSGVWQSRSGYSAASRYLEHGKVGMWESPGRRLWFFPWNMWFLVWGGVAATAG
jgi:hypothetical protein